MVSSGTGRTKSFGAARKRRTQKSRGKLCRCARMLSKRFPKRSKSAQKFPARSRQVLVEEGDEVFKGSDDRSFRKLRFRSADCRFKNADRNFTSSEGNRRSYEFCRRKPSGREFITGRVPKNGARLCRLTSKLCRMSNRHNAKSGGAKNYYNRATFRAKNWNVPNAIWKPRRNNLMRRAKNIMSSMPTREKTIYKKLMRRFCWRKIRRTNLTR